jgi:hypothetical protein
MQASSAMDEGAETETEDDVEVDGHGRDDNSSSATWIHITSAQTLLAPDHV